MIFAGALLHMLPGVCEGTQFLGGMAVWGGIVIQQGDGGST
jgi:hypothetical protein